MPFAAISDLQLGQQEGAPNTLLLVGAYLLLAPSGGERGLWLPAALGAGAAGSLLAALLVPAHDAREPQHVTVIHEDYAGESQILVPATGPLPDAMRSLAAFGARPDTFGRWAAPAPRPLLAADMRHDATTEGRQHRIVLTAPSADRHELRFETPVDVRSVTINGAAVANETLDFVRCAGRACRRLEMILETAAPGPLPRLRWQAQRYGLGEEAAPLAAARPADAQPLRVGDREEVVRFIGEEQDDE